MQHAPAFRVFNITLLRTRPTPHVCGGFLVACQVDTPLMFYFSEIFFLVADRLRRITAAQFLYALNFSFNSHDRCRHDRNSHRHQSKGEGGALQQ